MPDLAIGHVQWHVSEDDGPPDVGMMLRLSASDTLWFGEIVTDRDNPPPERINGWGIIHYKDGQRRVIGKLFDNYDAGDLMDEISAAIRGQRP